MADFYDLNSLYKQLEKDIQNDLRKVAKEIQEDMKLFWLESVYASRSPYYDYTELLLNSAKVSEVKKINGEYIIEIYISDNNHINNAWYNLEELGITVGQKVTLEQVAERMAIIGRSDDIMVDMSNKWLDNSRAISEILSMLRNKYDILG
jgi:hypothetical protein